MILKYLSILFLSLLLTGCALFTDSTRIKGGESTHSSLTGSKTILKQSEDPQNISNAQTDSKVTKSIIVPAGSKIEVETPIISKDLKNPSKTVTNIERTIITLSSNSLFETKIEDNSKIQMGAAQKNTFQDVAAKLKSMKFISFIGIALFIFGMASLFWIPLRVIIGSYTTSLAIAGGGLLLTILPYLIIGQEKLILFCVIGGVVGYFFVYRYSKASTEAKMYKEWIDKDGDGLDDVSGLPKDKK